MYTINAEAKDYIDKSGRVQIRIKVTYKKWRVYSPTPVKVMPHFFKNGRVTGGDNKVQQNAIINKYISDTETKLLDALRTGIESEKDLSVLIKPGDYKPKSDAVTFINNFISNSEKRLSEGRIKHYKVVEKDIRTNGLSKDLRLINDEWLLRLENIYREEKLDINTINSKMKIAKTFLNKAVEMDLIEKKNFVKYKVPKYQQKDAEYLTEIELSKLHEFVKVVGKKGLQMAGYYFLLSCYTGYRISDVTAFDYSKSVKGNNIVLRAKKNNQLVSVAIHSRLKDVLIYIKENPLSLSQQHLRDYVKELMLLIGVKKHIKFHSGRHSFAMLLVVKGFRLEQIAELIGDSELITKVYARIHNPSLNKDILEKLG